MQIKLYPEKVFKDNNDDLLLQDASGYKKIKVGTLTPNISNANNWVSVNGSLSVLNENKLLVNPSSSGIDVVLPLNPSIGQEIEILSRNANRVNINLNGRFLESSALAEAPFLRGSARRTRLVYSDNNEGWIRVEGNLLAKFSYPSGMLLWLDDGSLNDKSGNSRNATALSGGSIPSSAIGLDEKPVLRYNAANNLETQITPFLSGQSGATLYCVFTPNNSNNYNLIRTSNIDDYWRFTNDSNGYFGTFLNTRQNGYPTLMPATGNHLISIHSSSTTYEILQNNLSRGVRTSAANSAGFNPGTIFRIATNDRAYNGDIALILVYPGAIAPSSTQHQNIVRAIKNNYPSLPFTV